MLIETSLIILAFVFVYWLGCKRTQVKFELISLMTPKQYRNFTEVKLYVAKCMIVLLLAIVFLQKFNVIEVA